MTECYYQQEIYLNNPDAILKSVTDCVVITVEDSKRVNSINEQLEKYPLCKNTSIYYNKIYKVCDKGNYINSSCFDIHHCFRQICRNYKDTEWTLILEEDFQILPNALKHLPRIEEFFTSTDDCDVYSLGSLIGLSYPVIKDMRHRRVLIGGSAQAWIVSKKFKQRVALIPDNKLICNHDSYYISNSVVYTYKEPIIVQPRPISENMVTTWGKPQIPELLRKAIVKHIIYKIIKLNRAEKDGTRLYCNFHRCSDSGGIIGVILILIANIVLWYCLIRQLKKH